MARSAAIREENGSHIRDSYDSYFLGIVRMQEIAKPFDESAQVAVSAIFSVENLDHPVQERQPFSGPSHLTRQLGVIIMIFHINIPQRAIRIESIKIMP